MSTVVIGGLFVIAGVLISLGGQIVYDAWLNRRRMAVEIESLRVAIGRTTTYFRLRHLGEDVETLASGYVPATGWIFCGAQEEAAFLVLSFVLTMQNASRLDDAIASTEVEISLGGKAIAIAREAYAGGVRLFGTPVGAHGFHALGFDFAIPASSLPFLADDLAREQIVCALKVRTIRTQEFRLTCPLYPNLVQGRTNAAILPQPGLPDHYPGSPQADGVVTDDSEPQATE